MKLLLYLLVLLPLVYCASIDEKRFVADTLKNTLVAALGADGTQAECEHLCKAYLPLGCSSLCHGVIEEIQKLAAGK